MTQTSQILALVDPSQEKQQALLRAAFNAERSNSKPHITVFMAVDHEVHKQMKTKPVLYRNPKWIQEKLSKLTSAGLDYDIGVSWDSEWAEAVLGEIDRSKPDMVLVPVYEDEAGNQVLTDEIWRLLRSSDVNISLIHPRKDLSHEGRDVIIAGVKTQDPKFRERNLKVVAEAKHLAEIYGAELHIVNAYQDQMNFPDRSKILAMTGLPNENIHVELGRPGDVIAEVSKKVNADLALIAPARRSGFATTLRGATINQIIAKIDCDVMAIV